MWWTAHRGISAHYPENTLLAFRKALEAGMDAIELDVRLTADGVPVVVHDDTLERTTNGQGKVVDALSVSLANLDAGHGEPVPTLAEVLAVVDGKAAIFIELKTDCEQAVVQEVQKAVASGRWRYDQLPLIGFDHARLARARVLEPQIAIGASFNEAPHPGQLAQLKALLQPNAIIPNHQIVTPELVADAHSLDMSVHAWTVNSVNDAKRLIMTGADGAMSDDPSALRDALEPRTSHG